MEKEKYDKLYPDNKCKDYLLERESHENDIKYYQRKVNNLNQWIADKEKKIKLINEKIIKLMEKGGSTYEKYIKEYEKIKELPFIKEISINEKFIIEYQTEEIKMENINLGRLTIILTPKEVKVFSKERKEEYVHPHVNDTGKLCWGNLSALANKLFEQREMRRIVILINSYLKKMNYGDAYNYPPYWLRKGYRINPKVEKCESCLIYRKEKEPKEYYYDGLHLCDACHKMTREENGERECAICKEWTSEAKYIREQYLKEGVPSIITKAICPKCIKEQNMKRCIRCESYAPEEKLEKVIERKIGKVCPFCIGNNCYTIIKNEKQITP